MKLLAGAAAPSTVRASVDGLEFLALDATRVLSTGGCGAVGATKSGQPIGITFSLDHGPFLEGY